MKFQIDDIVRCVNPKLPLFYGVEFPIRTVINIEPDEPLYKGPPAVNGRPYAFGEDDLELIQRPLEVV